MNASQKVAQYLAEAKASEDALVRILQSQIAMTPSGSYRTSLESHLSDTRSHSQRLARRMRELGDGPGPVQFMVGLTEEVIGQAVAIGKAPLDLLRGTGGEEKILKNAKDAAATEALEIATYTAIEHLARSVGDETTVKLAQDIRADEEKMLDRILREIPRLTEAVVRADLRGDPSYDVTRTGAADAVREAADAVLGDDELPIAGYDTLTAEEINGRLPGLSQADLARVDSHERRHQDRATVLRRVEALRGDEPWPGYDGLKATEVESALTDADEEKVTEVRAYERAHKGRAGVLKAADRQRVAR